MRLKYSKYFLLTLGMIIVDQAVKIWVHYNIVLGPSGEVKVFGDWFKLHYILNEGMAFGIRFGSEYGKLGLTLFRIVAMVFISIYLYRMAKKGMHSGLLWSIALILGGAIGNVIDSTFYGVFFNNAPYDAVTPWFHGKVIDMFYLDVWEGTVADWVPIWGGEQLALWPIFNVADASIFAGVALILLFQKRFFAKSVLSNEPDMGLPAENLQVPTPVMTNESDGKAHLHYAHDETRKDEEGGTEETEKWET